MHADQEIEVVRQSQALVTVVFNLAHKTSERVNRLIDLSPVRTFAEEIPVGTESQPGKRFELGEYLGQVVVDALDFQFNGVEHINEIILLQIRLNERRSLPDPRSEERRVGKECR